MTRKEYNGWTNYETWVVALWMDNEQGSQRYWADIAQECFDNAEPVYASQTIKERALCVLADLLNAAMSEVNWYEIAEHLTGRPRIRTGGLQWLTVAAYT